MEISYHGSKHHSRCKIYSKVNPQNSSINRSHQSVKLTDVLVDAIANIIYHVESRPSEGGRGVLVESATGRDIIGREWNVRTGVMEYGGSPAMVHDGVAYFSNFSDGGLYLVDVKEGSEPRRGTPGRCGYIYIYQSFTPELQHVDIIANREQGSQICQLGCASQASSSAGLRSRRPHRRYFPDKRRQHALRD